MCIIPGNFNTPFMVIQAQHFAATLGFPLSLLLHILQTTCPADTSTASVLLSQAL